MPLPMGEVPPEGGGEGEFYPLSHFVTAPPEVEPRGDEGNGLPHQSADWFAMTIPISVHTKRKTDCDRRESLERATPVCALVRNDMHNMELSAKSIPSSARWSIEYTSAEHALAVSPADGFALPPG